MNKKILLSVGVVFIIGGVIFLTFKNNIVPLIKVDNQSMTNGQIIVSEVNINTPGWLVIQTETNGVPGLVVGYTKISKGENKNVSVNIDTSKSTPKLFAMIHEDSGEKGKFDFPGNDMPLVYKDNMVSKLFVIK